jgi:hypothetical protein
LRGESGSSRFESTEPAPTPEPRFKLGPAAEPVLKHAPVSASATRDSAALTGGKSAQGAWRADSAALAFAEPLPVTEPATAPQPVKSPVQLVPPAVGPGPAPNSTLAPTTAAINASMSSPNTIQRDRDGCPEPRDGLSKKCPLPFTWYKPSELYIEEIAMPKARPPGRLSRGEIKSICYPFRQFTVCEVLGVSRWPELFSQFQYIPYDSGERKTPKQSYFNDVMKRVGFDRAGLDAEHVWDVKLRGLEYDRLNNVWPASNKEQQLAGTLHMLQIREYESRLGNLAGRWLQITAIRHPANYKRP